MMGVIYDMAKRLADEGTSLDTILDVIRSMEDLKPRRKAKQTDDKACRLDKDWQLPMAWGKWAVEEWPGIDVEFVRQQGAAFRDYWVSKATNATKRDWEATWRNWMRKAVSPTSTRLPAPTTMTAVDRRRAALAQRVQNEHGIGRQRNPDPEPSGWLFDQSDGQLH